MSGRDTDQPAMPSGSRTAKHWSPAPLVLLLASDARSLLTATAAPDLLHRDRNRLFVTCVHTRFSFVTPLVLVAGGFRLAPQRLASGDFLWLVFWVNRGLIADDGSASGVASGLPSRLIELGTLPAEQQSPFSKAPSNKRPTAVSWCSARRESTKKKRDLWDKTAAAERERPQGQRGAANGRPSRSVPSRRSGA